MADYEDAFESVMQYTQADVREVDTQEKLFKFFSDNDRLNRMSNNFKEALIRTRGAKELIGSNSSIGEIKQRAATNKLRQKKQENQLKEKGLTPSGAHTTIKKSERFATFRSSQGKTVYFDNNQRVRSLNGRFAKK